LELGTVIDALYESEINCSIACFWDNGFTVKLGDEMNGFVAEKDCRTSSEAAMFLDNAAHQHYPDSTYALGRDEWGVDMLRERPVSGSLAETTFCMRANATARLCFCR
jgi:hypothetical protein